MNKVWRLNFEPVGEKRPVDPHGVNLNLGCGRDVKESLRRYGEGIFPRSPPPVIERQRLGSRLDLLSEAVRNHKAAHLRREWPCILRQMKIKVVCTEFPLLQQYSIAKR